MQTDLESQEQGQSYAPKGASAGGAREAQNQNRLNFEYRCARGARLKSPKIFKKNSPLLLVAPGSKVCTIHPNLEIVFLIAQLLKPVDRISSRHLLDILFYFAK